jgi:WD40 repeat protein
LASGSLDYTINIWNTDDGVLTRTWHTKSGYTLAVLQNGDLASGSADYTIKIWDSNSWDLKRTLTGHTDLNQTDFN